MRAWRELGKAVYQAAMMWASVVAVVFAGMAAWVHDWDKGVFFLLGAMILRQREPNEIIEYRSGSARKHGR